MEDQVCELLVATWRKVSTSKPIQAALLAIAVGIMIIAGGTEVAFLYGALSFWVFGFFAVLGVGVAAASILLGYSGWLAQELTKSERQLKEAERALGAKFKIDETFDEARRKCEWVIENGRPLNQDELQQYSTALVLYDGPHDLTEELSVAMDAEIQKFYDDEED